MKKLRYLSMAFTALALLVLSCQFEEDLTGGVIPPNENVPGTPSGFQVISACGQVELVWDSIYLASSYEVHADGQLVADGLKSASYTHPINHSDLVEFSVFARNQYGLTEVPTKASGKVLGSPSTIENLVASDGEFAAKVNLSWDAVEFATHYRITRGGQLLADNVAGTLYSDETDVPEEPTEYGVVAVGDCGETAEVKTTGYCDPLIAFAVPFSTDFEDLPLGELTSGFGGFRPRFKYVDAPNENGKVYGNDDHTKYMYLDLVPSGKSIQLLFPSFELLEGKNYRITFDIKTSHNVSLHMGIDKNGDGFVTKGADDYFMPTTVNPKNGNAAGLNLAGTGEWKSYSFDFPQSGTATGDTDPDPSALGWTLGTIQPGQEKPIFQIQCWNGKAAMNIAIDNIKIELLK